MHVTFTMTAKKVHSPAGNQQAIKPLSGTSCSSPAGLLQEEKHHWPHFTRCLKQLKQTNVVEGGGQKQAGKNYSNQAFSFCVITSNLNIGVLGPSQPNDQCKDSSHKRNSNCTEGKRKGYHLPENRNNRNPLFLNTSSCAQRHTPKGDKCDL